LAFTVSAKAATPVKIIFDTDMIGDYDDVGAMAVLHKLADQGECEILATVSSTHSNASAGTVELLNAWYGRPDIPVGAVKGAGVGGGSEKHRSHIKYERLLAKYPKLWRHRNANDAPDATDIYRRVLSAQPDGSVTICTVGFLTNLRRLLQSKSDRHSPLDGRTLVKRKVKVWYAMGWKIPRGRECNIMNDPESARYALENWPTPIVIDDFNYSQYIYAGRKVAALPDDGNPVRDIFAWCMPPAEKCPAAAEIIPTGRFKDNVKEGHNCFDQSCVLAAVRGPGSFFDVERGRMEMVGNKGDNVWTPDPAGPHARMVDKWPRTRVAALIDDLMAAPRTNRALVPVAPFEKTQYDWTNRHARILREQAAMDPEIVLLGDSITHEWAGRHSIGGDDALPRFKRAFEGYRVLDAGYGFDRIQNILWRLENGELDGIRPKLVVLLAGTNNMNLKSKADPTLANSTPEEIAEGVIAVVDRLRRKLPEAHMLVLGIFPRGRKAGSRCRVEGATANALIAAGLTGMERVSFADISGVFLGDDGVFPEELSHDALHLKDAGFDRWRTALQPWIEKYVPSKR
jgi:inosine-uridine nucleoside N-ribohydrolase/lysophospholipase L1-like esterase